jgi:hypothetical protein
VTGRRVINTNTCRKVKLPVARARRTPLSDERAGGIEHLNTIVPRIGYVQIVICIDGHAFRSTEVAVAGTNGTDRCLEHSRGVKLLNTMVTWIGHENVA